VIHYNIRKRRKNDNNNLVLNINVEGYKELYNYLNNSTNGILCKTCKAILSTKGLQQVEISHNIIMTYVECQICKDVFNASDLHIKNWSNSSNSSSNETPNVDINNFDRRAVVSDVRRSRRTKIMKRSNVLPILWKAGHRFPITIEDILTDSCAAKHEFEYLGIVIIDATTGNDVHWSKCCKYGIDKFKSTPPLHEGNCY
jgi:hypothetical protein